MAELWDKLLEAGKEDGLKPCGLGARDTLRLEARLNLYGQELTNDISPLEAGIGFAVKATKESEFIGKELLQNKKKKALKRKIVAIELTGRGIPRTVIKFSQQAKRKSVKLHLERKSPTLKKSIGLALLSAEHSKIGTELKVKVRNKRIDAVVVKTPFYKRA